MGGRGGGLETLCWGAWCGGWGVEGLKRCVGERRRAWTGCGLETLCLEAWWGGGGGVRNVFGGLVGWECGVRNVVFGGLVGWECGVRNVVLGGLVRVGVWCQKRCVGGPGEGGNVVSETLCWGAL